HLYLTDSDNLYVTTQYLHSAGQSRPLVRLTISMSGVDLFVYGRPDMTYDRERPDLLLRLAPPPAMDVQRDARMPKLLRWRLMLLTLEYLLRLARVVTYNIIADECEHSERALKDQLLGAFAYEPAEAGLIEFFVAERRRYVLKMI